MNLIESLRSKVVEHEKQKIDSWEQRRQLLISHLPSDLTRLEGNDIRMLGNNLSAAFQLPNLMHDRSQSGLSGSGSIWTALVGYYLNICLAGTDAIALNGKFLPKPIKEALKVTHSSASSTKLNSDIDLAVVNIVGVSALEAASRPNVQNQFSVVADQKFRQSSAIIVQTKTNWNDNAQIPLLWNLIYKLARDGKIPENGISIGSGRHHISNLRGFGYSFVTVPSQRDITKYRPNSASVVRVQALTCGAFWGRPSKNGIIDSISEFFNKAYNRNRQCFPSPDHIGGGYCAELHRRSGEIDLDVFDLIRP